MGWLELAWLLSRLDAAVPFCETVMECMNPGLAHFLNEKENKK